MAISIVLMCLVPVLVYGSGYAFTPPHCCPPRQFSATVSKTGGTLNIAEGPESFDETIQIYVDHDAGMQRTFNTGVNPNGTTFPYSIITNYTTTTNYFLKDEDHHCQSYGSFPETFLCVPKEGEYIGRRVIGSHDNNFSIDVWKVKPGQTADTMSFTSDGCLPFVRTLTDLSSTKPSQSIFTYSNVNTGVPDGIFNLPTSCQQH
ncbi:uncharacterized protein LOC110463150 [Mizuhopecten yessoensis]|uniref:Ependymin-related protein 1 n=1 Tax=Mizuhopecten yessoensis TaxID=6573 RepID=A0A210PWZ7_MIZYE|nr:uncharacterized protein LOC110463150 [Mizuhopecten yessoensis]OWF40986.1 hypothetical protein KP79_PYT16014 [Mizuhopecten yessoensis]